MAASNCLAAKLRVSLETVQQEESEELETLNRFPSHS